MTVAWDIFRGRRVEPGAASTRGGGAHGSNGRVLFHNPVRPRPTTGTTGERDAMSGGESLPIDTILLKTASRCNIACTYCYVYQLGDQGWATSAAGYVHNRR